MLSPTEASGSAQNSSLNALNNDFTKLLQSFGSNTGTTNSTANSPVTLQAFLQTLVQNMSNPNNSALNNPGGIVSTQA